ncbi:hypothetical protein [Cellulomonas oligotrophica]|uniref:Uncharacterized protein n=1 Tax=Cellulomonas oligotrophica TaxID=931536 RepID=A0A7Y9JZC5_9CELL|nr:hypothetical protein [Cellulomonas oligotrophica]NYD87786.1 hypothetical protein [Cellulomonas oligotrophica]GIG33010.1 hypothetical protein Col01nite_21690 [Cellulomonas oligotrophica]
MRAELVAAGRETSARGVLALALAARVDRGRMETGSSFASLARATRETLADALRDVEPEGDELDDLKERRDGKRGRARGTA